MFDKCMQGKKLSLIFVSIFVVIVLFQYRFNFFSTFSCDVTRNRFDGNTAVYKTDRNSSRRGIPIDVQRKSTCSPKDHVLFLKTHKTGSSTITNILNRYADRNNLTVLLPKGAQFYSFDWPNKFRLGSSVSSFKRPNFLINHSRYSRKSMNVLFPRDVTTYISILRHPVSQWESTFQYMSFPYILNIAHMKDPMEFFLDNLPNSEKIADLARQFPSFYLIRNPLFFDLGMDHKNYNNATHIRRALKTLDTDFDLILIMEYFDESLTLLRRRLCWDIDDVVNFKLNERLNKNKHKELLESQIEKIKQWNSADMSLYNFFLEKFWREVKNEGPGFYDDVAKLKERRAYYSNLCVAGEAVEEAYSSVFVKGYKMRINLTRSDEIFCKRMLTNELRYLDYFRASRKSWINSLEGVSIENFDTAKDEVDMFADIPELIYSDYNYGRPKNKKKVKIISEEPVNDVKESYKTGEVVDDGTEKSDEINVDNNSNDIGRSETSY